MSHSLSLSHTLTLSHSYRFDEEILYFLIQESSIDNIVALDITDQDILPPKHGELTKI